MIIKINELIQYLEDRKGSHVMKFIECEDQVEKSHIATRCDELQEIINYLEELIEKEEKQH